LEKGYPDIWTKKQNLENEVMTIYDEIDQTIKQYESLIDSQIPDKFERMSNYDPQKILRQPLYYPNSAYEGLFQEINKSFDNTPQLTLRFRHDRNIQKIINKRVITTQIESVSVDRYVLADGDRQDLETFNIIFQGLQANEQLINLVKLYDELQLKLSKINMNDFYNDIDSLWKDIKENRNILKGKEACEHCPKKSIFDHF
jgi:hypothetical protein